LKLYRKISNGLSVNDILKMTGVPRSTIYAKAKEKSIKIKLQLKWLSLSSSSTEFIYFLNMYSIDFVSLDGTYHKGHNVLPQDHP
jgi:hypothetical protein